MTAPGVPMRVLLAPHGTRGDVQPMIALALGLGRRGHDVRFVAPANDVGWIGSYGFPCASDGIDVEAVLRSPDADLQSFRWQMRHFTNLLVPQLFESVARASAGADLIVGSGVQLAAASVAELRGVPSVTAVFCPCAVPGGASPPPTVRRQTLPKWVNRLLWRCGGPVGDALLRVPINAGRAQLGLPPARSPMKLLLGGGLLVAADPDLGPLGSDAPAHAVQTDAWILDDATGLEPRVEAFLKSGPPPVYVGFGSMIWNDSRRLVSSVLAAAQACRCRMIVSGGWAALDDGLTSSDDVLPIAMAPHHALLPRVAAAVHHGGAGTTTAAARAGVPQVILPHILDQYYWAHRIEELGLGPASLPVERVDAKALTDRIGRVLGESRFHERARELGPRVAGRNGVAAGVAYLERMDPRCRT